MLLINNKSTFFEEKAAIYESQAAYFATGEKPFEQGLCAIFKKAVKAARREASDSKIPAFIKWLSLEVRPADHSMENADMALRLFDEIAKLENLASSPQAKPEFWPWACAVPKVEEQSDIAERALVNVKLDIECLGLKGLQDTQRQYMARTSRTHTTRDGWTISIPPSFIDERIIARTLSDNTLEKSLHAKEDRSNLAAIFLVSASVIATFAGIVGLTELGRSRCEAENAARASISYHP